jgi:hypothetical protein
MLTWRADDICTRRRWGITCHDRHKRSGGYIFIGEAVGEIGDPESCCCGGD